jgi:hypothetical protein
MGPARPGSSSVERKSLFGKHAYLNVSGDNPIIVDAMVAPHARDIEGEVMWLAIGKHRKKRRRVDVIRRRIKRPIRDHRSGYVGSERPLQ